MTYLVSSGTLNLNLVSLSWCWHLICENFRGFSVVGWSGPVWSYLKKRQQRKSKYMCNCVYFRHTALLVWERSSRQHLHRCLLWTIHRRSAWAAVRSWGASQHTGWVWHLELDQISELNLNHIRSTVDRIDAGLIFVDWHWPNSTSTSDLQPVSFETYWSLSTWVVSLLVKCDRYLDVPHKTQPFYDPFSWTTRMSRY